MEPLEEKLKILGIEGKEAILYMALLRLKKATTTQLSRFTGIKRTTVYHCIESLMKLELVSKIETDGLKQYVAENPQVTLNTLIEERNRNVKLLIPELKDIFGMESYHPEIKIYHNEAGLRKIFEDVIYSKEKIGRYYVSDLDIDNILGKEFLSDFLKKRIERGVRSLSLRSFGYKPEREQDTTHAKQLREVKFLPDEIKVQPYMCIYDHKVVVISSKESKFGFIIESKEFAEAQKTIFDMLWNSIAI